MDHGSSGAGAKELKEDWELLSSSNLQKTLFFQGGEIRAGWGKWLHMVLLAGEVLS